ncbi:MAG: nitrate reductase molybdenum cofactor assembly chaperone [Acidimicrobiales bacterium]
MIPAAAVLAIGFRYPGPGSAERLGAGVAGIPDGPVRRAFEAFVDDVSALPLSAWEELHTTTLDLNPRFAPYIGHAIWADNYQRGAFMAELAAAQADLGVDGGGELPDHVEPVLRYLAVADRPVASLVPVIGQALAQMRRALVTADPTNPYRHLLDAVVALVADLRPVSIGGAR